MTYHNNDSAEALSLTSSFGASLPPEAVAALLPMLTRSQNPLAELLSVVLNAAMKLERQEHLGVQPHERNPERNGQANGFKDRTLSTRLGQIGVSVPQVRGGEGSFRPASLEAALLSEKALKVALAEMYVQGVATARCAAHRTHASRQGDFGGSLWFFRLLHGSEPCRQGVG